MNLFLVVGVTGGIKRGGVSALGIARSKERVLEIIASNEGKYEEFRRYDLDTCRKLTAEDARAALGIQPKASAPEPEPHVDALDQPDEIAEADEAESEVQSEEPRRRGRPRKQQ